MNGKDLTTVAVREIAGKVIVITGSSSGIGRAVAMGLGKLGAKIVFNGRSRARLSTVVKAAETQGVNAVGVCADITSAWGAKHLIDGAFKAFGRADVLVNNAGISGPPPMPFWQIKQRDWNNTIATNLIGPILCSSAYIRKINRQNMAGRILNVSSAAGSRAYPGLAPYCASKFGLRGYTECQARDLEGTGVVTVCLELGSHQTPMIKRRVTPDDYKRLAAPDEALELFIFAVTGAPELLHGRTLSELRFKTDGDAEARLNSPLSLVNPWWPYMPRYITGPSSPPGQLHLDFLENPNGPPASAHDVIKHIDGAVIAQYPDPRLTSLSNMLAQRLKLPQECFTFGNGSTELVERVLRTFAHPGDNVVSTDPTWPVFERLCRAQGVELSQVSYTIDRKKGVARLSFDDILEAVDSRTRLIYIVNPNNPLGTAIAESDFLRFLSRLSPHIPVVVDEAYIEYSENADTMRANRHIRGIDRPLIGIRTFSKFFGLAGARIGYAFAAPEIMRILTRLQLPFAVSGIAGAAATAALNDSEHAEKTRRTVQQGREQLRAALTGMGVVSLSSETNFLMAEVSVEPGRVYDALAEKGIFLPETFWKGFMQLPISFAEDNERYLRIIARLRGSRNV